MTATAAPTVRLHAEPVAAAPAREQLWRELGLPVEFVADPDAADFLLVDGRDSEQRLQQLKHIPREVLLTRHVDLVDRRDPRKPWPRSLLTDALKQSVFRRAKGLDQRAWSLVTGVSPLTRAAMVAIFEIGYRSLRLVHTPEEEDAARKIREDFAKFCFGFEVELQKRAELTLTPNNGSLLVNVEDLAADADLLQTLLYLNFLHRPGLVVDLSETKPGDSQLLKEAALSGFGTVSGIEVRSEWDLLLLRQIGIPCDLDVASYHERLATLAP